MPRQEKERRLTALSVFCGSCSRWLADFLPFENERRIRIRFSVPLPPNYWRYFIRFSMIGGSVYVLVTNLAG